jgi:hypothetical protein
VLGASSIGMTGGTMPSPNSPAFSANYCKFQIRISPTGTTNSTMLFYDIDIPGVGRNVYTAVIGNAWNTTTPVIDLKANFNIASQEIRVDYMTVELMTKN